MFRGGSRGGGSSFRGGGGDRGGGGFRGGRGGGGGFRGGNGESSLGFRTIGGGVRGGKRGGGDFNNNDRRGGGRGGGSFRGGRGGGRGGRRTSFGDYGNPDKDEEYNNRRGYNQRRNNNNDDDENQEEQEQVPPPPPTRFAVPAGFGKQYSDLPSQHEDQYYNRGQQQQQQNDGENVNEDAAAASAPSNILELGQGGNEVRINGTSSLRYSVVCSILTNKPITFNLKNNNNSSTNAATALPAEAVSFLRLISQITTGSKFSLSSNGSELKFTPGLITAAGSIAHEYNPPPTQQQQQSVSEDGSAAAARPNSNIRGLGYFIEPLLLILPFSRRATSVTLVGPSHSDNDLCPHTLRTVTMRIAQAFGIECNLRIVRHSGKNSGCVILNVTPARKLKPVKLLELGFISRVRGIAFGADVSPDLPQRAAVAAKGALLNFLPDVYVVTDIAQSPKTRTPNEGAAAGNARQTAAFGVMLVAETTTKRAVISQEATAANREDPDVVGKRAVELLLDEVASGCCVDRHHQSLTLMLMALAPDDVSSVRFGSITPAGLSTLDLMEKFLSVRPVIKDSQVDEAPESGVIVSCFGSATINLTKRSG